MGKALEEISASKQDHQQTTKKLLKNDWSSVAEDLYHERASNPKAAQHSKVFKSMCAGHECFNKRHPNEGEYLTAAKKDLLTMPDRSIAALRHSKWLTGRGAGRMFPKPPLSLMGNSHPVKERVEKQVETMTSEVLSKGPIKGPMNAKERLAAKAKVDKKLGKGLPALIPAMQHNKPLNPLIFKTEQYRSEKEKIVAERPERSNHLRAQPMPFYTRGCGDLFNKHLMPLSESGMQREKEASLQSTLTSEQFS